MSEKTKCSKCGYECETKMKYNHPLCVICFKFAPDNEDSFKEYLNEKVDGVMLETFRKHLVFFGENQKKGMIQKAQKGELMSRVPFGYKIEKGRLIPAENYREVEEIFEEFLTTNISLTQLAKKHTFSVNGLKKILKNFTYIGKIKFNGMIHPGNHQPIVSSTLFNHVQNKLERLSKKL
ncbi:MAG: recombinase family protein [Candidatus Pacearchaeota archaeon]